MTLDVKGFASGFQTCPLDELDEASVCTVGGADDQNLPKHATVIQTEPNGSR